MKRQFLSLLTVGILLLSIGIAAIAMREEAVYSDVGADAWYGDAVEYCREKGLMSGTSDRAFSPDTATTRAMLVTILYRQAGSPAVEPRTGFSDVPEGAWYDDALAWAHAGGVVGGYSDGRFGPGDPVTREQLAAILWRSMGSPAPSGDGADFEDQAAVSAYALDAVRWAQESGIVSGGSDGRFDPKGSATRAQVAAMLHRLGTSGTPETPVPEKASRVLVAYFSATGHTESVAGHIADTLDATSYEITPEAPYTAADLDYNDPGSRSQVERRDAGARPAIAGPAADLEDYDVVFLGYPIWNGQAPKIISTFLESGDFAGKTIVPFCTSGSSGIGSSAVELQALAPGADWLAGSRFSGGASQSEVSGWVESLELPSKREPAPITPTEEEAMQTLLIDIDGKTFTAALENNDTARELCTRLPMTVTMGELHGNEKYYYLDEALPTDSSNPGRVQTGDLMLYGDNCVVLFYKGFSTSFSYTRLGRVRDTAGLAAALGAGDVEVGFRMAG